MKLILLSPHHLLYQRRHNLRRLFNCFFNAFLPVNSESYSSPAQVLPCDFDPLPAGNFSSPPSLGEISSGLIFNLPPLPLQVAGQQPTCLKHQVCLSQQWTSFCYEVSPSPEGSLIISDKASQKISRAMQASNSFVRQIYLNLRSNWKAIPGRVQLYIKIQTKMC